MKMYDIGGQEIKLEKIKSFYLLNNNINYSEYLFSKYYKEVIINNPYLSSTFLQIERTLKRIEVKNNLLYKNNSPWLKEELYLKDLLGTLKSVEIIKKMSSVSHVYEIRMNMNYTKTRILFFVFGSKEESLINPSLILSFGFEKRTDRTVKDMTQLLTEETQFIRDNLYNEDFNKDSIGVELYHEI